MADTTIQVSKANTPSIQSSSLVLAANVYRNAFTIQNHGTNPLFVMFGTAATLTQFHIILQGGTAVNDGKGGIYSQTSGLCYQGIITSTGTAPTYTVLEL